jgi:hypothetical protein
MQPAEKISVGNRLMKEQTRTFVKKNSALVFQWRASIHPTHRSIGEYRLTE